MEAADCSLADVRRFGAGRPEYFIEIEAIAAG